MGQALLIRHMEGLSLEKKTPEQIQKEQQQLHVEDQKTENVMEEQSRIPGGPDVVQRPQTKR